MSGFQYTLEQVYEMTQAKLKALQPRPEDMTREQIIVLMAEYLEGFESFFYVDLVEEDGVPGDENAFCQRLKQEKSEVWRALIKKEGEKWVNGSSFSVMNTDYQDLVAEKPCHKKIIEFYLKYNADRSIYFKVNKYCSLSKSFGLIRPYFPDNKPELLEKIDIECNKVNCEKDPLLTQTFKELLGMIKKQMESYESQDI